MRHGHKGSCMSVGIHGAERVCGSPRIKARSNQAHHDYLVFADSVNESSDMFSVWYIRAPFVWTSGSPVDTIRIVPEFSSSTIRPQDGRHCIRLARIADDLHHAMHITLSHRLRHAHRQSRRDTNAPDICNIRPQFNLRSAARNPPSNRQRLN